MSLDKRGTQMAKQSKNKEGRQIKAKLSDRHSAKADPLQSSNSEKAKKAFEIDIFMGWCKSCGICAAFCPRECIKKDEDGAPIVEDADRCTGCGWCEVHCPDFAISVRPRNLKTLTPGEE
jgi:2-oxoglutarate ferredoxin oxidoreductase subunit delta